MSLTVNVAAMQQRASEMNAALLAALMPFPEARLVAAAVLTQFDG